MAFSPGQFITAQRLNRLQPKTYWSAASGVTTTVLTNADVAGTPMSIVVETNGATAAFVWHTAVYANAGVAMSGAASSRVLWDVNASPVVAIAYWSGTTERGTPGQSWVTTIGTAGTYTFKMQVTTAANTAIQVFTSMSVTITEVA
jgi:hypothetical protein